MKHFRFSLHALWVLRGQQEELARRRLADSLRAVETAAARVRETEAMLARAADAFLQDLAAAAPAGGLQPHRLWMQQLQALLRQRLASWQAAREAAAERWQELLRARRDREILDRYRERQWQSWQLACQRLEQKQLDELAQRRRAWTVAPAAKPALRTVSRP
ncbi:flagellar export protein FliJ [Limisphaera sp. VF-2]|jgi:flagellar export protein FliJ|uniref:flagellar export protein FliJ n=1 Tax=Limisphaera sp. VF-2 TaxID=3400418 RepID=UPI0017606752